MDQKRIGSFLKALRKEKGVTQEQLAEILGVSGRTVSRWETGSNLPDLSVLVEIADYYDVEIRELLDGERKNKTMDQEMKETALKMADYSNAEKEKLRKRICLLFVAGFFMFTIYNMITLPVLPSSSSHIGDFLTGVTLGFSYGVMIVGVLYTSGLLEKIKARIKKK